MLSKCPPGVLTLCKGLAHNTTLRALNLDSILLGSDKYAVQLMKTLTQKNSTLNRLDLNKNNLYGIGARTSHLSPRFLFFFVIVGGVFMLVILLFL